MIAKELKNSCQSCKTLTTFGENIHLEKYQPYAHAVKKVKFKEEQMIVTMIAKARPVLKIGMQLDSLLSSLPLKKEKLPF